MDRQKQRNGPITGRARNGVDGCRFGQQKTGRGRFDCNTGAFGRARRRRRCFACAVSISFTERNTETNFSRRTKFRGRWSTGSGCESAAGSSENPTWRRRISSRFAKISGCSSGRIRRFFNNTARKSVAGPWRNRVTVAMKMSILPNE